MQNASAFTGSLSTGRVCAPQRADGDPRVQWIPLNTSRPNPIAFVLILF